MATIIESHDMTTKISFERWRGPSNMISPFVHFVKKHTWCSQKKLESNIEWILDLSILEFIGTKLTVGSTYVYQF